MKTKPGVWALALTTIFSSPCVAQDVAAIQNIEDGFSKALASGDGKAAASIYESDATLVPPGEPLVKGQAAIETYWGKQGSNLSEFKLTTTDVQAMGSGILREIGTFAGKTKGDAPQSFSGKYVVLFQKDGNDWKIATDIWNNDK